MKRQPTTKESLRKLKHSVFDAEFAKKFAIIHVVLISIGASAIFVLNTYLQNFSREYLISTKLLNDDFQIYSMFLVKFYIVFIIGVFAVAFFLNFVPIAVMRTLEANNDTLLKCTSHYIVVFICVIINMMMLLNMFTTNNASKVVKIIIILLTIASGVVMITLAADKLYHSNLMKKYHFSLKWLLSVSIVILFFVILFKVVNLDTNIYFNTIWITLYSLIIASLVADITSRDLVFITLRDNQLLKNITLINFVEKYVCFSIVTVVACFFLLFLRLIYEVNQSDPSNVLMVVIMVVSSVWILFISRNKLSYVLSIIALIGIILLSNVGYFIFKRFADGILYVSHDNNYIVIDQKCAEINSFDLKTYVKDESGIYYINNFKKLIGRKIIFKEKRDDKAEKIRFTSANLSNCDKVEVQFCMDDNKFFCK